jgi:hypothetical protein
MIAGAKTRVFTSYARLRLCNSSKILHRRDTRLAIASLFAKRTPALGFIDNKTDVEAANTTV